jgi:glycyl-tRNA synthetase beta chain
VALADKLDQICGFFTIGEKPTGSGDPYALRRAALGALRIVLENSIRIGLVDTIRPNLKTHMRAQNWRAPDDVKAETAKYLISTGRGGHGNIVLTSLGEQQDFALSSAWQSTPGAEIMVFLADRLKVALREKGTRHDLIDAVFSLGNEDDLVRLVARVEALQSFLKTDEGANLLAGYKRAANILKAEEKKDKTTFDGEPDAGLLVLPEEKALAGALASASKSIAADVAAEKFVEAMGVMAKLRAPVDAFFDKVTVNDKDATLRENRLKLLARLRSTLHLVADFSKIEG